MIDSIKYAGLWFTKHSGLLWNSRYSTCAVLSITVSSVAIITDGILPSWALIPGLNNTGIHKQNYKFWPWEIHVSVDGLWKTAQFQWFTLCLFRFLWRWGPAAPQLPATPPATQVNSRLWRVPQRPQNYHKRFSGQMPSPALAWADRSHLARLTYDHHDQLSHLH